MKVVVGMIAKNPADKQLNKKYSNISSKLTQK